LTELELYYNKFNEEKRLDSRHGQVEFITSMKYIHKYLESMELQKPKSEIKILDVGAATGRYSVPLAEEGYDVTAVELVKHNLARLKAKGSSVKAYQGNAMKLNALRIILLMWYWFLDQCIICMKKKKSKRLCLRRNVL